MAYLIPSGERRSNALDRFEERRRRELSKLPSLLWVGFFFVLTAFIGSMLILTRPVPEDIDVYCKKNLDNIGLSAYPKEFRGMNTFQFADYLKTGQDLPEAFKACLSKYYTAVSEYNAKFFVIFLCLGAVGFLVGAVTAGKMDHLASATRVGTWASLAYAGKASASHFFNPTRIDSVVNFLVELFLAFAFFTAIYIIREDQAQRGVRIPRNIFDMRISLGENGGRSRRWKWW